MALLFAVRAALNFTALLAIGLGLQTALEIVEPYQRRLWLWRAAVAAGLLLAFALARLAITNAGLGDGPLAAFDPAMFSWTWMSLGASTLFILAGVVLIGLAAWTGNRFPAGGGALLIAASFGVTGHVAAMESPGLSPLAAALHLLIAGYWVAAPITLFPRQDLSDAVVWGRMKRFSRWAVVAIPIMMALGFWLAWLLAGGLAGLTTTAYGQLLVAKMLAAGGALSLGALNHRFITDLMAKDPARGRRWLKTSLLVESALFVLAVGLVSAATSLVGPGHAG